jgi:hypothetical protein
MADKFNDQSSIENANAAPKSTGVLTNVTAILSQAISDDIKRLRHQINPNVSKHRSKIIIFSIILSLSLEFGRR